ncbi:MAG: hypothetical protein ACD_28C00379G0004 [uncultured bacterium]|nr:MAG: hypothetical protein ACD_28C00379G0004 [uncultured bacterium]KKT74017.1 MAG: Short-chain dehydrogenase/reductase SDR [Candidatus Peregrinibacteria bacterium GW2011_GWA2_44_7]
MPKFKNIKPTALITGASSGIGLEFAKLFAAAGHDLILVARNEKTLNELASELKKKNDVQIMILAKDLSDLKSVETVVKKLETEKISIDVLINNAGFGDYGRFIKTNWEKERQMMELNMVTLTYLSKVFAQKMAKKGSGKILNVASMAGFQPGPLMAVYYATKAYVLSFSEAVAYELRNTGVTVTALCPGPTASGFQEAAALNRSDLFSGKLPSSAEVAQAGYEGLMKGKTLVIPGFKNKLFIQLLRLAPRGLVRKVVYQMQKERSS